MLDTNYQMKSLIWTKNFQVLCFCCIFGCVSSPYLWCLCVCICACLFVCLCFKQGLWIRKNVNDSNFDSYNFYRLTLPSNAISCGVSASTFKHKLQYGFFSSGKDEQSHCFSGLLWKRMKIFLFSTSHDLVAVLQHKYRNIIIRTCRLPVFDLKYYRIRITKTVTYFVCVDVFTFI